MNKFAFKSFLINAINESRAKQNKPRGRQCNIEDNLLMVIFFMHYKGKSLKEIEAVTNIKTATLRNYISDKSNLRCLQDKEHPFYQKVQNYKRKAKDRVEQLQREEMERIARGR